MGAVWYNLANREVIPMGMTDKQFNSFVRLILDTLNEVLDNMPEGANKDKLQKLADNLQKSLED